jgi:GT2 family glycosyltransferase
MMTNELGVVAIGRNEGERLVNCLASIKSNAGNVVYVDSGSTDNSVETAKQAQVTVVPLDLTRPFTAARARNAGFAALKTLVPDVQFVQFIDSDCTLAPAWIESAIAFIKQREDVAAVCGRRRERHPAASIYNRLCDLEWDTPIGEALACGGDVLIRVKAFEEAGGFRSQLIAGEEPELCVRLREGAWKIWRLNAEMTSHDAAMTRFGQWWVRSLRCGYAYAEVSWLHRKSPFGIWRRETARAIIWGGLLPIAISAGALVHPVALAGVLVYLLQIIRIASSRGSDTSRPWIFALFVTLSKPAEFLGILKFWRFQLSPQPAVLIEYK